MKSWCMHMGCCAKVEITDDVCSALVSSCMVTLGTSASMKLKTPVGAKAPTTLRPISNRSGSPCSIQPIRYMAPTTKPT